MQLDDKAGPILFHGFTKGEQKDTVTSLLHVPKNQVNSM